MPRRESLGARLRREYIEHERARRRQEAEFEAAELFLLDDFHQQVLDFLAFPDEWREDHPERLQ